MESAEEPKQSLTPLAMAMLTLGMLPVSPVPDPEVPPAVERGPTAEYGGYIAGYVDCAICHGGDLSGGTDPILPMGPNLVTVKSWTADQFISVMRTGVSPTRGPLDPTRCRGRPRAARGRRAGGALRVRQERALALTIIMLRSKGSRSDDPGEELPVLREPWGAGRELA